MTSLPERVQDQVNQWAREQGGYPSYPAIVELGYVEVSELADLWERSRGASFPVKGQIRLLGMRVQPVDAASHLWVRGGR